MDASDTINPLYLPGGHVPVPEFAACIASPRRYLPTFAELLDRLTIVQLKEIFIPEHRDEYRRERADIEHDLDLILAEKRAAGINLSAKALHAVSMVMLTNRYIWENEARARQGGTDQDKLLKLTHSINGVRNTAKNVISKELGDRIDLKIDCFAENLIAEFGNWNIFHVGNTDGR